MSKRHERRYLAALDRITMGQIERAIARIKRALDITRADDMLLEVRERLHHALGVRKDRALRTLPAVVNCDKRQLRAEERACLLD